MCLSLTLITSRYLFFFMKRRRPQEERERKIEKRTRRDQEQRWWWWEKSFGREKKSKHEKHDGKEMKIKVMKKTCYTHSLRTFLFMTTSFHWIPYDKTWCFFCRWFPCFLSQTLTHHHHWLTTLLVSRCIFIIIKSNSIIPSSLLFLFPLKIINIIIPAMIIIPLLLHHHRWWKIPVPSFLDNIFFSRLCSFRLCF